MDTIWKIRDGELRLGKKTYVMGIVNVTPDSFSDGGAYCDPTAAVQHALALAAEGVDILDIGGQSTRPGHTEISPEAEWQRIAPVLAQLMGKTTLPISVDTYFPEVAARALALGVHIINDVSGIITRDMAELVARYGAGWMIMHAAKIDENADPIETVAAWMKQAVDTAVGFGVDKNQLCVDPGIGFGKNTAQNYALMRETARIKPDGMAYLLGASRKRCIGAVTRTPPSERDCGTIAAHTIGILGGADIIRVHAGAQAVQAARVADAILQRDCGITAE